MGKLSLVEHLAFVRNSAGKNHVKRADSVGDDHEQLIAEVEYIAHLAALARHAGNGAFQQRIVLVVFHVKPFYGKN